MTPEPSVNAETATYVNASFTNYNDKDTSQLPDKVLAKVVEITDEEIGSSDFEEKFLNEVPREFNYSGMDFGEESRIFLRNSRILIVML